MSLNANLPLQDSPDRASSRPSGSDVRTTSPELRRFYVTKTQVSVYQVYADSKKEAESLVKSKTPYAGLPTQKGASQLWFDPPLQPTFKVAEDKEYHEK